MAGLEIAEAYVTLLPSMKGMQKRISSEMGAAGLSGGKEFNKSAGGIIKRGAKTLFAPITSAWAGVGAALGGGALLKGSIQESSDLAESVNAINVAYEKNAEQVLQIGKNSATAFGLSKTEFNEASVSLSNFVKNIAGDGGNVVGTLEDLIGRGTDFASVFNLDVSEAMTLFQSGLAGETEPLRRYGIDLSAATVEQYALANGIWDGTGAMTEQEKVLARYGALMEQTSNTEGDFASTSDQLANKQRILGASWDNLRAQLGDYFLPIIEKVVGWLADKAVPAIANFFDEMQTGEGAGGRFVEFLRGLRDRAVAAFDYFKTNVLPRLREFGEYLRDEVVPRVISLVKWLGENKDTLIAVASAAAGGLAAFMAYRKIMSFIKWLKAARLAVMGLNIALRANPIGIVITAIGALVGALIWLYNNNEDVKNFIDAAWAKIKDVIGVVVTWFRETAWPIIQKVLAWIGEKAGWLWENAIKPAFEFIWNLMKKVWAWVQETGWPAARDAFQWIGDKATWLWENAIQPAFDFIKDGVKTVVRAFEAAKSGIGKAWDKVRQFVAKPIVAVVNFINDGIIGSINWVLDKLGLDSLKIGKIKLPVDLINASRGYFGGTSRVGGGGMMEMAAGGVLPGYSPGKDNYFFRGDDFDLALAGGEAIMRPEWTRAVGPNFVEAMNAVARTRGVSGVRKALGFADGGVVPGGKGGNPLDFLGDLWDAVTGFLDDPVQWLKDRFTSLLPDMAKPFYDIASGVIGKTVEGAKDFVLNALGFGPGGETGAAGGRGKGLPWQAIWSMIQEVAPEARMTSNYRPGAITASGYVSYHGRDGGRAVDFVSPNMMATFRKVRNLLAWSELYYSPAGWMQMRNGMPHYPTGITRDMHFDHIHAAYAKGGIFSGLYDEGGWLPPGLSIVANRSGKPEPVLTDDQWDSLISDRRGDTFILHGVPMDMAGEVAATINYEVKRTRRGKYARR